MGPLAIMAIVLIPALIIASAVVFTIKRYKRCPSNRILVIYGKVGKDKSSICIHGGGKFVYPLIQDYHYLSLEPITIDINLTGALSKQNIRINTPSTFTIGISTDPDLMNNAAERLLGLNETQIRTQAEDIILGQLRLVIATLDIEEINQDRETFLSQINKNVASELDKLGLTLINVNIKDITDESGYIEAIGKKAAAEAVNKAKIEVAMQEKIGETGQAKARRELDVEVARETSESLKGQKDAEIDQIVKIAELESLGVSKKAEALKNQEINVAKQQAEAEKGKKEAEAMKRVSISELEYQAIEGEKAAEQKKRVSIAEKDAAAVEGENISKARIADSNAELAEKSAEARKRGDVARANADKDILMAEKQAEIARLEKEQLALQEVDKKRLEIEAEAQAEKARRIAKGDADATLARFQAEAEGLKSLLRSKAEGYKEIIQAVGGESQIATSLLMIEKMEFMVEKQVEAISKLKIDKITVWDSGGTEGSSTANFVKSIVTALPPLQELARQAGIELPEYLGKIGGEKLASLGQTSVKQETRSGKA
ncbi:MAG: flotillin family protein [Leptospiraceae bacterium]|nr:flotillin family protein [Leptospiraceae bacterium]MCP5499077.1 flotillin family protein [Leptospiraceae bacterium]